MEKKREASVKKNGNGANATLNPIDLKASVDLVSFLESQGIEFTRHGTTLMGLCPFHQDTKPSLSVTPGKHLWHCFGCDAGGDVITFLQKKENLSFQEALVRLQEWQGTGSGVACLRADTHRQGAQGSGKNHGNRPPKPSGNGGKTKSHSPSALNPAQVLQRVVEFYHQIFREDSRGVQYLQSRGLHDRDLFSAFQIGFSNGTLLSTIPKDGELKAVLTRLGILNDKGNEFFHNCVIFPLTNEDGQVMGIYGRSTDPEANVPHRYLPGPRSGLFNGSAAKRSHELILTESVLDAMALIQGGFPNTIPLYGTNGLTEDHLIALVKHSTQKIRLCLDNDQAGREAVPKIAERLQARGIQVLDIVLSEKDPCDFFQKHSASEFQPFLEQAKLVEKTPSPEPACALHADRPPAQRPSPDPPFPFAETKPFSETEETPDTLTQTLGNVTYQIRRFPTLSDQLRVHLRATFQDKSHRDTLDLFSHRARQGFVNQLSRKFGLLKLEVDSHLAKLLEALETLPESGKAGGIPVSSAPQMTDSEKEVTLGFLRSPALVSEILSDMETLGYVGESHTKLLAYLIGISRKLESPLSGIIISQSGAGKSQLAELIESLTPPEEVVLYSRLSSQALCYMERDALKRKLLIIEEKHGSDAADYSIRTLQTRAKITQGVVIKDPQTGRMHTKTYIVEGPISYLVTTTSTELNHENLTRCFELYLDESLEQTQRIHKLQRESKTEEGLLLRERAEKIHRKHQNAQRLLTMGRVVIPYAPLLSFPEAWLRTRRDHHRFLCLIEAVTFLLQYQRQRKTIPSDSGEPLSYLESTIEDYQIAYDLAKDVLGHTLDELGKASRELLEEIQAMVTTLARDSRKDPEEILFTRREIREWTRWPDHKLKECLRQLEDLEYLLVLSGHKGKAYCYQLSQRVPTDVKLVGLLSPLELKAKLGELG